MDTPAFASFGSKAISTVGKNGPVFLKVDRNFETLMDESGNIIFFCYFDERNVKRNSAKGKGIFCTSLYTNRPKTGSFISKLNLKYF